jgi:hypothetical protein
MNQSPAAATDAERQELLQVYTMYAESALRLSELRANQNNYYIAVNTAAVGAIGYFYLNSSEKLLVLWIFLGIGGTLINACWLAATKSYRNINKAKFLIIQDYEKRLRESPFTKEWQIVKKNIVHFSISNTEMIVGFAFLLAHLAFLLVSLSSFLRSKAHVLTCLTP